MIDQRLLDRLSCITPEEEVLLQGADTINRSLYMEGHSSVINSRKLLHAGKLITVRPHTRFVHFPAHSHDYIEVVYVLQGSIRHIIDGTEIRLNAGELLFLGKNACHEILPAGKEDVAVNLIVLPEFFDSPLTMLQDEDSPVKQFLIDSLTAKGEQAHYMHFAVSDVVPIQNLMENLLLTLLGDTPNKRKISGYTMGLLFLHLTGATEHLAHQSEQEQAIIKMFRYVDEHYTDGSLTELCSLLHYDFSWFSREIKRKTGKTYTEIIQERRLSQAAFWLKNTRMTISDIALRIGYDNKSYFHRLFKEKYGQSPLQFRREK